MTAENSNLNAPLALSGERGELARAGAAEGALASLAEVPLQVEVRLGHARLSLGELLRLQAGSVLTLDRRVEEPAEVLVGGKVVARGQIVAVGDELGVRVTELARPAGERP